MKRLNGCFCVNINYIFLSFFSFVDESGQFFAKFIIVLAWKWHQYWCICNNLQIIRFECDLRYIPNGQPWNEFELNNVRLSTKFITNVGASFQCLIACIWISSAWQLNHLAFRSILGLYNNWWRRCWLLNICSKSIKNLNETTFWCNSKQPYKLFVISFDVYKLIYFSHASWSL